MIGYFRDLRLLPIAVAASACLFLLVAADLFLDRNLPGAGDLSSVAETEVVHVAPGVTRASDPKESWAQQMFNFPDASGAKGERIDLAMLPKKAADKSDKNNNYDIITGSVPEAAKSATKNDTKDDGKAKANKPPVAGKEGQQAGPATKDNLANLAPPEIKIVPGGTGMAAPSTAERAILERLQERREELDKRSRELDIREGLIAEAEKRIDARLAQIKEAKAQLAVAEHQKDEAEAARFKGLVTMYETMKPRDAAKIFDRLDTSVLMEMASQINPRAMAEILAQMSPDAAQRLTVELAGAAKAGPKDPNADLPKIEGRPVGQ